jgi:glycosyltransferase involved in cell wall biosynthesis
MRRRCPSDPSQGTPLALPLSIYLITFNEADRLPAALAAIAGLADEIVVVDSGSTDGTQAIAEAAGARVIHHDWPGYGPQKRFAEEQCRHDWLLNLDADEVMDAAQVAAVRAVFAEGPPAPAGYRMWRVELFPGERVPHRFAYGQWLVRLYHREAGRYAASTVHDTVLMAPGARVADLAGTMLHFSVRSLGSELQKLNGYSDLQVLDLEARGVRLSFPRLFLEFPAAFLKAYLGRRHALRGAYGFMTAMNYAFFRYLRLAKHWERRLGRNRSEAP